MSEIAVFISHSSRDLPVASALARLLEQGLGLNREEIRCTSAPEYRLSAGVDFDDVLRTEVAAARMLIGLVTPHSRESEYVLFELGARWGARLPLVPLLACGSTSTDLPVPLARLNAVTSYEGAQLHQLLNDVAAQLNRKVRPAHSYDGELKEVLRYGAMPQPTGMDDSGRNEDRSPAALGPLVDTLHNLCKRAAADEYDIYSRSEIPERFLKNARRQYGYVSHRDRVMALVPNSGKGQDGLAILESGISWRNSHTQPNVRLTWSELARLSIRDKRDRTIGIGPDLFIDLNGGDADAAVVAKLLRNLVRAVKTAATPL